MSRLTADEVRAELGRLAAQRRPLLAEKAEVNRRLADLTREMAPLIVLADVHGIPRAEIARLAGVTRQTVYTILGVD